MKQDNFEQATLSYQKGYAMTRLYNFTKLNGVQNPTTMPRFVKEKSQINHI